MSGRLAASIIEARNVDGDKQAELCFYVRLRVGGHEAKTHKVSGSTSPKFLMDLRLEVLHPKTDALTLELLQAGPRGDLVVGCAEVSVAPLAEQGTLVHWFPLSNAAQRVGAELCVVLRYAPSSRPASSYTIPAHPEQGAPAAPGTPDEQKGATKLALQAAAAADPGRPTTPQPATPQPHQAAAAAAWPSPITPRGGGALAASPRRSPHASTRRRHEAQQAVPMPLAVAGGMVLGAVAYLWKARAVYYEVQPGDAVCSIGACSTRGRGSDQAGGAGSQRRAASSRAAAVPDIIFPGDRLRIK